MGKAADGFRRGTTLFGAVFQVLAGFLIPVGAFALGEASLIIPAGWAFAVWGPIFSLCAVYAVYQALPSNGRDPLLRAIGWPLGLAFVGNGLWAFLVPVRQSVLLQAILFAILIAVLVAFVRFVRLERINPGGLERWVVGLPVGLLAGWLTVANVVSFNDLLVGFGVLGNGLVAAFVGAGLLIVGAVVATVVLKAVSRGPLQATVAYALGVVWGLFGVVANQYDASLLTSGVAAVCLVVLLFMLLGVVVRNRAMRPDSGDVRAL